MTNYEIAALAISGVSLLVSAFAAVMSLLANAKSSSATIELGLLDTITSASEKVMDCSADMDDLVSRKDSLTTEEQTQLEFKKKRFDTAVENLLNAYEEACAKYVDKKIDKERFKKNYFRSIRNVVENEKFKDYYVGVQSNYKATLKVYKEWFDFEK
jgi:Skp family chaperone for outer membrane proteins